jgi:hypothetical protein
MTSDDRERGREATEPELKITDRRHFTAEGDLRTDLVDEPDSRVAEHARVPAGGPEFERRPLDQPSGVDFTMLINAMAEPALLFLGEIAHPSTGRPIVDLDRARFQIDMLDLLRVKCRGNLDPEEEGLLERILYQLRMLYVARTNQPKP